MKVSDEESTLLTEAKSYEQAADQLLAMGPKLVAITLGELLIDFTEAGHSQDGRKLFEQNPGGAPANLLTVASHFGYCQQ